MLGSSGTPIPITLASMLLQAKDVRSNAGAKVTIGKKDYYIAPKLVFFSAFLVEATSQSRFTEEPPNK